MLTMMLALTATATPIYITPSTRSRVVLRADLDEDGVVEQVVVGFSLRREIHVAVYEPDGQVRRLSLGPVVDLSGVRDELFVSLTDPEETGVPLLLLAVPAAEQCGSWGRDTFVSDQSGQLHAALSLTNGSDSPAYMEEEVVFSPESRTAILTTIAGDDSGETTTITRRALIGGVFETTSTTEHAQVF
ncbi:MAG: hypothetical protein P8R54_24925 [Myxococcota bacterium]|nr:hypothetical protein [Myxococcota bacterium]